MSESTILTIGGTVCTALIGAIATLWKDHVRSKAKSEERYLQCEERHNKTQIELLHVTEEVGELKGSIHLAREIGPKLEALSMIAPKIDELRKVIEDKIGQ